MAKAKILMNKPTSKYFLTFAAVIMLALGWLFRGVIPSENVLFSNDGPLGGLTSDMGALPESLSGIWHTEYLGHPEIPLYVAAINGSMRFLFGAPFFLLLSVFGGFTISGWITKRGFLRSIALGLWSVWFSILAMALISLPLFWLTGHEYFIAITYVLTVFCFTTLLMYYLATTEPFQSK